MSELFRPITEPATWPGGANEEENANKRNLGETQMKSKPKHSAVSLIKNLENLAVSDNESADENFTETFYDELEGLRENLRSDTLMYYEISVTEKVAYWRVEKLIENFIEDCWYKKDLGYICIGKSARMNKAKGKKRNFREMFDEAVNGAAVRNAVPTNLSAIRRYILVLQDLPQAIRMEYTERALIRKYKEIYNQYVLNDGVGAKSHEEGDWIFFNLYRPKPRTRNSVSEPQNDSSAHSPTKRLAPLPNNTLAATKRPAKADRSDYQASEHADSSLQSNNGALNQVSNGLPRDNPITYSPTKQQPIARSNPVTAADKGTVAVTTGSSNSQQVVPLTGDNPTKQLVVFLSSFFESPEHEMKMKANPSDSETSDYASLKQSTSTLSSSNNGQLNRISVATSSSAGSSKSKVSENSTVRSQTNQRQSTLPVTKWPPRDIEDAIKQFSNGVCPSCGVKNLNLAPFYEQGVKNINQSKYVKEHLKEKHKIKV